MTHIPPKNSLEKQFEGNPKKGESRQPNNHRPSADFTALIDAIKAEGSTYRREEKSEDSRKSFREWVTVVLLGFTLVAVCFQVNEMIKVYEPIKTQAEAAKHSTDLFFDQTAAAHPPKLAITMVVASKSAEDQGQVPEFVPGEPIFIRVNLINQGDTGADIAEALCTVEWLPLPLPMYRPYNQVVDKLSIDESGRRERTRRYQTGLDGLEKGGSFFKEPVAFQNFPSGQIGTWRRETKVPKDIAVSGEHLFVMGYIEYRNEVPLEHPHATQGRHVTLFTREYDPSKRRFVPVQGYPEYEGYE